MNVPPRHTLPLPLGDLEHDPTVISQRPAAAPVEFARSLSLIELARSLEGRQLHHFAVERMIGGGGMGAVFRGRDLRLDRDVAIKVIPESRRDPETLRRFRMEAQSAARLDHPNIARVYDIGEDEAWNYIVFEFIDGINLRDLVQMEGPMGIDDAVFTTRQVAEALQHAHDRDVVHRDIKPSNVIITPTGVAKVVDMGLARNTALDRSTADQTASGVTLGTFDYISPEQARDPRDADVRSDLYSLGCTLFYMLTGQPPFPDGTALQKLLNHGSQPPPDPRQWRDDISDQLYAVLAKLMAKRPVDRYQKPLELINDLLLIAQLESLPRSRTAGTILLRPTVAQRSLLETHLPWLVPLSVLLLTAFWLQSADSLTAPLDLPAPMFSASASQNRAPSREFAPPAAMDNSSSSNAANSASAAASAPRLASESASSRGGISSGSPREIGGEPLLEPSGLAAPVAEYPGLGLPSAPTAAASANAQDMPPPEFSRREGEDGVAPPRTLTPLGPTPPAAAPLPLESLAGSAATALNNFRDRSFPPFSPRSPIGPAAAGESTPPSIAGGAVKPTPGSALAPIGGSAGAGASATATSSGTGSISERTAEPRLPAAAVRDTILVRSVQPELLPAGALWCSSLSEALSQAGMNSDVRVIELQESIELDHAVTIPRSGLILRSAPGTAVDIVMTGERAYGMGWETWFDIGRLSLQCDGLRFTCRNDMRQTQAVFALRPGGQLMLNECAVTMADNHDAPLGFAVVISEPDRAASSLTPMPGTSLNTSGLNSSSLNGSGLSSGGLAGLAPTAESGPVSVAIRNCVLRGNQTVVAMRSACRSEITLEDSCAMVEGRVLTIRGLEQDRMPPVVRVILEQSTLVCGQGFASLQTGFVQRAPLTLMRTAKLCAFWSPSMTPHIAIDGLASEEMLEEVLQLRGEENGYDQKIETLCQCRFSDGRHIDFSFRDATGEWFRERGNDNSLLWQNPVPPERPMDEQLPEDYRLRDGMFMPGFSPGSLPLAGTREPN